MKYVNLGKSGLKVSKLILGCMSYGASAYQDWILDEPEGIEHIKFAYEAGINTFDTANTYSGGKSEEVLGKALKEIGCAREAVVILTKVYNPVSKGVTQTGDEKNSPDYVNQWGLSRKHIFDSVQASLKRLQLDYIDVLQCHRFDKNTPIEETMQALHDVVQAGWVRYIGMSSCYAYQFQAMQNYALNNHLTPFISMQNFYNAAYREEEREMVPTCDMFGVGMIPWSPLCRGFLARPWDAGDTKRTVSDKTYKARGHHQPSDALKAVNERIAELAQKKNATMAQIALAWVMTNPTVSAPIIGSTTIDNIKDLLKGLDIHLTHQETKYISDPYEPQRITGHE